MTQTHHLYSQISYPSLISFLCILALLICILRRWVAFIFKSSFSHCGPPPNKVFSPCALAHNLDTDWPMRNFCWIRFSNPFCSQLGLIFFDPILLGLHPLPQKAHLGHITFFGLINLSKLKISMHTPPSPIGPLWRWSVGNSRLDLSIFSWVATNLEGVICGSSSSRRLPSSQ